MLFGRMHGGAGAAARWACSSTLCRLGSILTAPPSRQACTSGHARLPELVAHEHAPLALGVLQSSSHLVSAEAQRTLTTSPNVVRTGKGGARSRMSAGFAYGREPPRPEESLTRFAHSSEFSNPCRTSGGDSCILFGRRTKNDRTPRISKRRRQSIVSAGLNPELRESMGA